ncbi:major facilitator superfamily domain-containing protein [Pseudomassariella vexata]|uniref:Major facilitator superfamily domain-containing protein n=1 Tax=Pseudomassariella vexata TaxID=1141098 RepID=A0A1Y2DZV8_9PEZI|nr:major facilitator superfamily domain-containing protein [Pseudomassariella vexata]ORY64822.1 major facilitator superfamily domain-containing protein [Pseudomassariella vexata]
MESHRHLQPIRLCLHQHHDAPSHRAHGAHFEAEFHKSLPEVNMLFGAAAITLGYSNLLIVPTANVFGRRPVIIVCGLICTLANIWQGLVTSHSSFIGARVISGLGAGANESIMPMVIADLLFLHQRGKSMALYFWSYFMGLFMGPIISGAIASQISWRWFPQLQLPLNSSKHPASQPIPWDATPKPRPRLTITTSALLPKGKLSKSQLCFLPRVRFDPGSFLRDILSPLQILFYPIVLWASLTMGFAANALLALNLTEAQVSSPPPYLFTPAQIGYTNFAFAIGAAVALFTAGSFSDWITLQRAKRNHGILEAEFRLPALVPYVFVNLVGMTVTAVGYQRGWPWEAVVVVGIPAVAIAYATDCYKALPGEIVIAATIVKNTFGFGMIFFFNDWAARQGYIAPVLLLMVLTVGSSIIGLALFIPFGKTFRRMTKDSTLHTL